jgi:hypothetical protein
MAVELSTDTIKNWKGDTVEAQLDMFKHMLMFILAKEHGLDKLLSESEWVTLSLPVIEDYADFYATDMLDDVLIAYDVPDLLLFPDWHTHVGDEELLLQLDSLYVDFIRGVSGDKYEQLYARIANEIDRVYFYFCYIDYLKNFVSFVWRNIFALQAFASSLCGNQMLPILCISSLVDGISGLVNVSPVFTYSYSYCDPSCFPVNRKTFFPCIACFLSSSRNLYFRRSIVITSPTRHPCHSTVP